MDEGRSKAWIGDERNVKVDGGTTYLISGVQLPHRMGFGDIDTHIYLLLVQHLQSLRIFPLVRWPEDLDVVNAVL